MSHPARAPAIGLIIAVASLSALGGYVMANVTARADPELLKLVERLVEADRGASIISVGIVAATAILASLAIPAMTIFALLRHERNQTHDENPVHLEPHRRDSRLPVPKRVAARSYLGGRHDCRAANRLGCDLPSRVRPGRRALGSQVPHHGSEEER